MVNALLKLRFQAFKIWPVLWVLTPAGLHNPVYEIRTLGRSGHPVAMFDFLKYIFFTDT